MRILFIGDIFAAAGRRIVSENLARIVASEQIDLAIANAENAAGGFGITPLVAEELLSFGLDALTSGNHIWDKREIHDYLPHQPRLLRPANYSDDLPGAGVVVATTSGGISCAVISLQGRTHMPLTECPFRKADRILAALDPAVKVRFLDFHADVTSEKIAMGWYLDGKVTAVLGTHTHVQTADERILPGGAAYITDVGMTGPFDSVIGINKDSILRRFLLQIPNKLDVAKGDVRLQGVTVEAASDGRATAVERLDVPLEEPGRSF